MKFWWVLLFLSFFAGCLEKTDSNNNENGLDEEINDLGQLNPASSISLFDPASSPHTDSTPTLLVEGIRPRDRIYVYYDSNCQQIIASADSTGDTLAITLPRLLPSTYNFSVKRRWEDDNIESACLRNVINYQVWDNNLIITGLNNDTIPTQTKSWNWGCSGEETACEYRFAVTSNPSHNFGNQAYGLVNSAGQTNGTDTIYLHVQARDFYRTFLKTPVESYSAVIDNTGPEPVSMQAPLDGTYNLSKNLDFILTFNEAVVVSGTPRIALQIGGPTRYADYHSTTLGNAELIFRYTPQSGDSDFGGIDFASTQIDLNQGSIQDLAGNQATLDFGTQAPSLTNINVNAAAPQITGLADDMIPQKSKTWIWGCNRPSCTYRFAIDNIGATAPTGAYSSSISTTQNSGDGLYYLNIQVRDQYGYESDIQRFSTILDNSSPVVDSIISPANATYSQAQAIDFTFNFNEPINIVGTPQVSLTVGSTTRTASYTSGSGSRAIIFRYLPQVGDADSDGIAFSNTNIDLNAGSIKDVAENDAVIDFSGQIPSLGSVLIDGVAPFVTNINPPSDGTYNTSSTLDFTLTFSENIVVTDTPHLVLSIGGQNRNAEFYSSSSNQATFRYIPEFGDLDSDGILFQTPYIQTIGGQVRDTAGNLANLNFTSAIPTLSGVLIDARRAEVTSIVSPPNQTYNSTDALNFLFNFGLDVTVTGLPRLALWVGSEIRYATYQSASSSSKILAFRYSLQSGDFDSDGISFAQPQIDLNGGSINDVSNDTAVINFSSSIPNMSGIIVDAILPAPINLLDDSVYKLNKSWSWGCSKTNCTYRFVVDTNATTVPSGAYSSTPTNTSQSSGNGTHYLHIQVQDDANNESPVMHFSALLDNTAPDLSGTLEIEESDVSPTSAAIADWSAMALSDAHSGVSKIEIAIGEDLNSNGLEATERNNVVDWREIPNGPSLNPARYQTQDGVDGFSLNLTPRKNYFISLRLEDALGNQSVELSSRAWTLFDPRHVAGLKLWLDGKDSNTLFQQSDCSSAVNASGDAVGCWQDKSTENNHAVQSNAARMPTYHTGGHIFFHNANHLLDAGNVLTAGTYGELSTFVVFDKVADTSHNYQMIFNLNALSSSTCSGVVDTGRIATFLYGTTDLFYWDFGKCSGRRMIISALTGGRNFYHMGNSLTDGTMFIRRAGTSLSSTSASHTVTTTSSSRAIVGNNEHVGTSSPYGEISELIVYDAQISVSDREKLEGYLACKWGLQSKLPTGHAYISDCP